MPLLLSHNPDLILAKRASGFFIQQMPDWLAQYLGGSEATFLDREAFSILEAALPGLREAILEVASAGGPVQGYELTLQGADHVTHQLVMDVRRLPGESGDDLRIAIHLQEPPKHSAWTADDMAQATFHGLIGISPAMIKVFNRIRLYAHSDAPVLVTGETGAGKEGVAQALHRISPRQKASFVTVNCSAITETLFESEVFGHERGSFTGAVRSHRGKFERADHGTLFLDEIGDLPLPSQAKLLRVLEEGAIERVGGEKNISVDVRVVAATNRDLEMESRQQTFRTDLFYRINALQIHLPPLRERPEDIEPLVQLFIRTLNRKYDRRVVCLTHDAMDLLKQYRWPGNVRELRNLMERLFAENQTEVIGLRALREWFEERKQAANKVPYDPKVTLLPYRTAIPLGMDGPVHNPAGKAPNHLPADTHTWHSPGRPGTNGSPPQMDNPAEPIETTRVSRPASPDLPSPDLTIETLKEAFRKADGNITKAANLLGIHKATFYRHLKELGLTREDLV